MPKSLLANDRSSVDARAAIWESRLISDASILLADVYHLLAFFSILKCYKNLGAATCLVSACGDTGVLAATVFEIISEILEL